MGVADMKAIVCATRDDADRVVAAIDAARCPDGTEEAVRYVRGREVARERRPAKRWAEPVELEDGRVAVPWKDERLDAIAGREVTVRGERLRVPRVQDMSEIEIATDDAGDPVTREDGTLVLRERRLS